MRTENRATTDELLDAGLGGYLRAAEEGQAPARSELLAATRTWPTP